MYHKLEKEQENNKNNSFMLLLAMFFAFFPHQALAQDAGGVSIVHGSCSNENTATQLICNFGSIIELAVIFGYVLSGILFFVAGLYIYLSQKKPQQYGPGAIIGALLAATLFLGFTNLVTVYQNLVFSDNDIYELHQYNETLQRIGGDNGHFNYMSSESMRALLGFVKLVGVIAMLKSIYLVYDAGRGNDPNKNVYFQILVYAVGGAMAFRIEDVSCIISDFFNITSICLLN